MDSEQQSLSDFYREASRYYDDDYASIGYEEDIPYYVDLARRSPGPVLEVGCGTGRVLIPALKSGAEIWGLDLSRDMLGQLHRRVLRDSPQLEEKLRLIQGDMRSFQAGRRFPLILAPFRSVQHLLTGLDQRRWLRNMSGHLLEGGRLVFDVFQPDFKRIALPAVPRVEVDRVDPGSGGRVVRTVTVAHRPEFQLMDVQAQWESFDPGGERLSSTTSSFTLRWFTRGELLNLLELEGFEVAAYWGDFRRTPFAAGASQQVVEAVRASTL